MTAAVKVLRTSCTILSDEFYEEERGSEDTNVLNYSLDNSEGLHVPLTINFDFPYMRFDPVARPTQLKRETYRAAFAEFLQGACDLLELASA